MTQPQDSPEPNESTFIAHLMELRNRLLYSVIGIFVVFCALVPFSNKWYVLLARPLMEVLPKGAGMIATDLASTFLTPLKLTVALSIVVSIPYLLYQLWAFIAPGLYKNERKLVLPLLVSSTLLFYTGMAFAYFFIFPVVFHFFTTNAPPGVTVMTDIKSYLDFVFSLFFAFGVAFETPIATILLVKIGFVKADKLSEKRPYVVLGIFIVAAFLTPPDAFSQILLAVPMWLLFEAGLFFAHRLKSNSDEDAAMSRDLTAAEMDAELDTYEKQNPVSRKKRIK